MTAAERQRRRRQRLKAASANEAKEAVDAEKAALRDTIERQKREIARLQYHIFTLSKLLGQRGRIDPDLWRDLMLCVHPDGSASEAVRHRAFVGLNERKDALLA